MKKTVILLTTFLVVFLSIYIFSNKTARAFYALEYGLKEEQVYDILGKSKEVKVEDGIKEVTYKTYYFRPKDSFPFFKKTINTEYTVYIKTVFL